MNQSNLIFLKLGGSLITDKTHPLTPCIETIQRLSTEIVQAFRDNQTMQLLIGHGSGSFGHAVAERYKTQTGGENTAYWFGFIEVWRAARELNQIIYQHLSEAGLPIMAFPPSACVIAAGKQIQGWDITPIETALSHGIIPLVQGDVAFDTELGGTILSTETLFRHLARHLRPGRILLAGLEQGVYRDPEKPDDIFSHITPATIEDTLPALTGTNTADVTGGMSSKVQQMVSLVEEIPTLQVQIFSGQAECNLQKALTGHRFGTLISS
ncbi:MAG: isopentenyl phosphate kinase [Chloroflexota bacterium]|nr:isopentenyl phosphate kinase [Chloroflexota bacterium]